MKRIILVPIEPLEMRYTIQWKKWFTETIECDGRFELFVVDPEPLTTEITTGAFLDVVGTNYYKSKQLTILCQMAHNGIITDDTTILLLDGWFPGIEMLSYIRDALKIDFKLVACFHAGTYDPTDFISKMGMGSWGRDIENAWLQIYDKIFVASDFHKSLIERNRTVSPGKVKITGFPIFQPIADTTNKEKIIVFPHRLADDKRPDLFDELIYLLKPNFPEWQFIKTQEEKRTKTQYYNLLGKSFMVVSFAEHENWGISTQEALFLDCIPIVPNRSSYSEMYPTIFKYENFIEAINLIEDTLDDFGTNFLEGMYAAVRCTKEKLLKCGHDAIPNILEELL